MELRANCLRRKKEDGGGRRIISHSRYKILLAVLGFLVLMSNIILDSKISDGNNSAATLFKPNLLLVI